MGAMEMLGSGSNLAREVWGFGSKGDLVQLRGYVFGRFFAEYPHGLLSPQCSSFSGLKEALVLRLNVGT